MEAHRCGEQRRQIRMNHEYNWLVLCDCGEYVREMLGELCSSKNVVIVKIRLSRFSYKIIFIWGMRIRTDTNSCLYRYFKLQ